jgi:hypothetical protein
MPFHASDIVFFFGAGASAPFEIPTMKQMVADFEQELSKNGTADEIEIYNDVKKVLETILGASVDLEAVFTVINGIINYDIERLGLLSIYSSATSFAKLLTEVPPSIKTKTTCTNLRTKFQNFVREKCLIPPHSYGTIGDVYRDFFNRFCVETIFRPSPICQTRGKYKYCPTWTMFTTNYDTCLEYYWREIVRVPLNTGFEFDRARNTMVLTPHTLYDGYRPNEMRLLKLHGSVSWLIEKDGTVIEETALGPSLLGRKFIGELMIYPIEQKELYVDPYISMFVQLNRELKNKSIWVIIGYSFNDPVIREVFIRNSDETKRIVLLHPDAQNVKEQRLMNIKCGEMFSLNQKFGQGDFRLVSYSLIKQLEPNPQRPPTEEI